MRHLRLVALLAVWVFPANVAFATSPPSAAMSPWLFGQRKPHQRIRFPPARDDLSR